MVKSMRKRVKWTGCAAAFMLLWPAAAMAQTTAQTPAGNQQQIEQLEQQVQSYLHEQKPQLAIPLLRQIVSLDPRNLNANANLGVLLFFQGNYADAIPEMRTAVQTQPDLWKIRGLLGIAEKRTGDPNAAQSDLEQAFPHLDDKSFQKQAGLELIELESGFGQFGAALAVTDKLEEIFPQDPQVLFVAYEISSQMMDQSLLNMVLAAPDSAEMHMIMGGELGRAGDHAGSIAQYRNAIRLNPKLPGVHFELAEQLRASPDPAMNAQAADEYKAAVGENPYDEKGWCKLGDAIAEKGDFKAAEEDYRKALALQPRDADAETGLAIAMISTNQSDAAVPILENAIKDDPTNIVAHYRLSVLYRRAGRTADAQHQMSEYTHYKQLKDKMSQLVQQMRGQANAQTNSK
jgi:tetratricopeptide (TPR) repeat protein